MAKSLRNMMGAGIGAQSASLINGTVADNLTATGSAQADALALTADVNVLTTVAVLSGVRLPALPQPSDETMIANLGANALSVYPPPGATIEGGPSNAPFSLPAGAAAEFVARIGSANWIALATSGTVAGTPVNTVIPRLLDGLGSAVTTPLVGQRYFIDPGTWTNSPVSYTYQMYDDGGTLLGESGTWNVGDPAPYYLVQDTEVGHPLHVGVVASNGSSSTEALSTATSNVADIDLSADAPVLTRTSASGATPVTWDTTFGAHTYAGYIAQMQVSDGTGLLYDGELELSEAVIAGTANPDWTSATPAYSEPAGSVLHFKMRVKTITPQGRVFTSPYSATMEKTNPGWTPASLGAALAAWHDPSDITTLFQDVGAGTAVAANNDPVALMQDKSGNAVHVSNAATNRRPTYHPNAGKPYLQFDKVDDLLASAAATLTDGSGQHTVVIAVSFDDLTGVPTPISSDTGGTSLAQFIRVNSGNVETIAFYAAGGAIVDAGPAVSAATGIVLMEITSTSATEAYLNNSGNGSTPVSAALQSSANPLVIGAQDTAGNQLFGGKYYGSFVNKGVLGSSDRTSAQTYYAGKM